MNSLMTHFVLIGVTTCLLCGCEPTSPAPVITGFKFDDRAGATVCWSAHLQGGVLQLEIDEYFAYGIGFNWFPSDPRQRLYPHPEYGMVLYNGPIYTIEYELSEAESQQFKLLYDKHKVWHHKTIRPRIEIADGSLQDFTFFGSDFQHSFMIDNSETAIVDDFTALLIEIANRWVESGIPMTTESLFPED